MIHVYHDMSKVYLTMQEQTLGDLKLNLPPMCCNQYVGFCSICGVCFLSRNIPWSLYNLQGIENTLMNINNNHISIILNDLEVVYDMLTVLEVKC